MTSAALNTGTWRYKVSLATWTFDLPMSMGSSPAGSLCKAAVGIWAAIDGFANVASVGWTTLSAGEDARVEHGGVSADRLRTVCDELGDVTHLEIDLDLRCVALDGSEGVIEDGAWLYVDLNWPDPVAPGKGQPTLTLSVRLHVDIYASENGGGEPANNALAALNAPRLTTFLRRVRADLGATQIDMDSHAGRSAIDEDGFVVSPISAM
jgi:hypothetical protein